MMGPEDKRLEFLRRIEEIQFTSPDLYQFLRSQFELLHQVVDTADAYLVANPNSYLMPELKTKLTKRIDNYLQS